VADIVRQDPFAMAFGPRGLRAAMDRIFDEPFFRTSATTEGGNDATLAVDIAETDGKLVVRASLPGYAKEDIDVSVKEGVLSINAKHAAESETRNEKYYRRERRYGSVSRHIALPATVHEAPVDAELKDGVLTLSIEVPAEPQPKQVEIKSA
jgi:HSP20 family protein